VLSLLKPQYEAEPDEVDRGVVPPGRAQEIAERVVRKLGSAGISVVECVLSPVEGGKGNREFFLKVEVA
jgi:predicted rRNA methylase YqxC with S4 and FtsJ domains